MRRHKAYTLLGIDRLEDRLTLSSLGTHPVAHVADHHAASLAHHHGAQVARHHAAHLAHHHHAAAVGNHSSGPVLPAAGSPPPASGTTPPAPVITPPAPGSTPPAPVTTPPDPAPTPPDPGPPTSPPGTTQPPTAMALSGQIAGPTPMVGTGTIGPLGAVTSSGTLSASGAEPMVYRGTETLVGASGSITLSLAGQVFGPVMIGGSVEMTYTITGGTGAFLGATGSGKAVLSFEFPSGARHSPSPSGGSVVLTFE